MTFCPALGPAQGTPPSALLAAVESFHLHHVGILGSESWKWIVSVFYISILGKLG
jgi:hypothetical protein